MDQGHGAVATDYSLGNWDRSSFNEQRQWPRLYSFLLAATSPAVANVKHASYLSVGLLFLCVVFVYFILEPRSNWFVALLSSLLLCLTLPMITVYSYAWSETLFIPLLIMVCWSSICYLDHDRIGSPRRQIYLFFTVLFLLLMAYTRYIGIMFGLLLPAMYIQSSKGRKDAIIFIGSIVLYGLGVGYMLVYNFLATGRLSGVARLATDKTIIENILDSISVLLMIVPSSAAALVVILIVSVVAYTALTNIVAVGNDRRLPFRSHDLMILGGVGGLYVIALQVLRTLVFFDSLDIRLLSPVFPILWTFLVLLPLKLRTSGGRHLLVGVMVTFLIFSVSVNGYRQFLGTVNNWKTLGQPNLLSNRDEAFMNYTIPEHRNTTKALFTQLSDPNGVVAIDNPIVFEFLTGLASVQIPALNHLQSIDQLNRLPEGSFLLLTRHDQKVAFSKLLEHRPLNINYLPMGNMIAIKIPIRFE